MKNLKTAEKTPEQAGPSKSFAVLVAASRARWRERAVWTAAVLAVIAVNGAALFSWVKRDTRPLSWDQAIHTKVAFDYRDRFNEGTSLLSPAFFNYPPLYHALVSFAIGRTDDIADAGALVNFFFLALLIAAVFVIGDELLGKWPALTACVFVSCYPIMADMARQTMIDLALTAVVAASVACLLRSDQFRRPVPSLLFGAFLGAALLMKWTASLYVLGPVLWALGGALPKRRILWPLASAAATLALIAPWYAVNIIPVVDRIHHLTGLPPANGVELKGALSWLWYPLALVEQLNLPFLILFIPGLFAVLWKPRLWPVFLWFVVSLAMFSLIHNRNVRYSMPALPAAALLSVAWFPSARRSLFVVANIAAAVFFTLLQFFPGHVPVLHAGSVQIPIVANQPPQRVNWQHGAIIDRIIQLKPKDKFSLILTVSNTGELHSTTLNISALNKGRTDFSFVGAPNHRWFEFADFILMKTGDRGPGFTLGAIDDCAHVMEHPPAWFSTVYKEAGRWPLPDGSAAILYHNEPSSTKAVSDALFDIALDEFHIPNVIAKKMSLRATALSPADTGNGKLKDLVLSCASVDYKGLVVRDVRLRLEKPQIILPLYLEFQEIELLSLDSMSADATVDAETLLAYARQKLPWLAEPAIRFDGPEIVVSGKVRGMPLRVRASLRVSGAMLRTKLEELTFAGVPFPRIFLRAVTDRDVPLTPNREIPFRLNIRAIQGDGQKLRIVSGA